MIRWLVIALFIYLMYRLITGPKRDKRKTPFFHFHAGRFPGAGAEDDQKRGRSSGKHKLDEIEDAEFEDITENEPSEKKSNT